MLENQDQDLTLTDLSHNTLNYQLSQNLNLHHQSPVMIKDIIYYNYSKTEPQTVQVINSSKTLLSQDIMSPSSNSSSSPSSVSINPNLKHSIDPHDMSGKSQKKSHKKKTTQVTSEIDEERTSQLVSELLKNIKEKTKELESLNQNLKSTNSNEPKSSIKLNNISHESDYSKTYSQDSFDMNDSMDFYDSDGSKSQTKQKVKIKKTTKHKSSKKLLETPQGWQRVFDMDNNVSYISPSGHNLKSHQDIKMYLLSDQTCKCGLECPLNIYDTFNFSPLVDAVSVVKKSSKNPCLCKHVPHGLKKQKNLVKVLDEVNQNSKRDKKSKRPKTSSNTEVYVQNQIQQNLENNMNQEQHQSILISNLILNSDNFTSNDLIFDTKNFNFTQTNQYNQIESNSYQTTSNQMPTVDLNQSNLNYSQDFNDICQVVNNQL